MAARIGWLGLLAFGLASCLGTKGGGEADPGDDGPLAELDTDGDGSLEPEDLDVGEAAALVELPVAEGTAEPAGLLATSGVLTPGGSEAWHLEVTLEGGYVLSVGFAGTYPIELGAAAVTNASLRHAETGFYAFLSETEATVEVTSVESDLVSGRLEGTLVLEVIENDSPTGQLAVIGAFAFRSVPIVLE